MSEFILRSARSLKAGSKSDFINLLATTESSRTLLAEMDALVQQALHGHSGDRAALTFDDPVRQATAQSIASFPLHFRRVGGNFVLASERHLTDCPETLDGLATKWGWDSLSYTKYFLQMKVSAAQARRPHVCAK